MLKLIAAGGCAAVLAACTTSVAPPAASPTPSPSAAGSPAASLRVHLDLLLAEHVFVIAKLAVAATSGRGDEFRSYAGLLATGGGDVAELLRSAAGETTGSQFGDAWTEQNNDLVDYLVAASTHDDRAGAAAMSKLTGTYVPHAATVLASNLSLSSDDATRLALGHVTSLKAVIDDAVAANFPQLFTDIGSARMQAVSFGDAIALQVARVFADRFPGDPSAPAATQRVSLNSLMQQQGYVMTMGTDAAVAGVKARSAAASAALNAGADQLAALMANQSGAASGTQFGAAWREEATLVIAYATTGDSAVRQNVLNRAAPSNGSLVNGPDLTASMEATLTVIDDQRQKQFGNVATDDRAMATAFATAADEVSLSAG